MPHWACDAAGFMTGPVTTDDTGMVTTPYITAGEYELWVHADGYLHKKIDVTVNDDEDVPVTVSMDTVGAVSGTITRTDGTPAGVMAVNLYREEGGLIGKYTDESSVFEISGLPAGNYVLYMLGADVVTVLDRQTFTLASNSMTYTYNKQLAFADAGGVVTAADGTAQSDVPIYLFKDGELITKTYTNNSGRYRFLVLVSGAYDIVAAHKDLGFMSLTDVSLVVDTDMDDLDFSPDSTGVCEVTVQTAEGDAVEDALVTLSLAAGSDYAGIQMAGHTPSDGTLAFNGLADGEYTVFVQTDGCVPQSVDITVTAGFGDAVVTLQAGRTLKGTVTNAYGDAAAGAAVTVMTIANGTVFPTFTDSSGYYEINDLPADACDVWVSHGYWGSAVKKGISTVSASSQTVDVSVSEGSGIIEGIVTDGDGEPVVGAMVSAMDPAGIRIATFVTDPFGAYRLTGLPSEELVLVVTGNRRSLQTSLVTPSAQSITLINLTVADPVAMAADAEETSGVSISFAGLIPPVNPINGEPTPVPDISDISWWFHSGELLPPQRANKDTYDWRHEFEKYSNPDCPLMGKEEWEDCLKSLDFLNSAFNNWVSTYNAYKGISDADTGLMVTKSTLWGAKAFLSVANMINGLTGVKSGLDYTSLSAENKIVADMVIDILTGALEQIGEYWATGKFEAADYVLNNVIKPIAKGDASFINSSLMYDKAAKLVKGKEHFMNIDAVFDDLTAPFGHIMNVIGVIETFDDLRKLNNELDELTNELMDINDLYLAAQDIYMKALARHHKNMMAYKAATEGDCCTDPPCVDPPDTPPEDRKKITGITSEDPNDKTTVGTGSAGWVAAGAPILYSIYFENVSTATAAAQQVVVTDSLDDNLDLDTLELVGVGFNDVHLSIASDLQSYSKSLVFVDSDTYPVKVAISLDPDTRILTCTIASYDLSTGDLPADPLAGFLPPNDDEGSGEGYVRFMVYPISGLSNGTEIHNQAEIVFDENDPILTSEVVNTLDTDRPSCVVQDLANTVSDTTFTVEWAGEDTDGSGAVRYDVYVSTNGGDFTAWLEDTAETSADFDGEDGSTYAFYCTAQDAAGLEQVYEAVIQARTEVNASSSDDSPGSGGGGGGCFVNALGSLF